MSASPSPVSNNFTHGQVLLILSGLLLGMFLAALDQTIVSTALPTIVGELGGLDHLSWVITAYLLTSTVTVPLYGKLSDIYGRKLLYMGAIGTFIVGSLLSGAAQSMLQLIIFRGIQGIGAGGIFALAMAIIGDVVPPRERGRYQGYFGAVFALSSVAGPLLGGFFVDNLTWRWAFFINLPLGAVAMLVTFSALKLPYRRLYHPIDYAGAALMVAGVSALLLVTAWGGTEYAWTSATILGLIAAGITLLVVFVWWETKAPEPLLPLRLFRMRVFSLCSSIAFLTGWGMLGAIAFLPLYMQVVKGVSATESGLRLLPMMVGVVGMSIISGRMISRTGRYRIYPIVGSFFMAAGLYLLSRLDIDTPFWEASLYMFVMGSGLGMVMQVTILAVQNDVEHRDMGTATAGVNFFRSMGGAFGVAILGSILNNRLDYYMPRLVPEGSTTGIDPSALRSSPHIIRSLPPDVVTGVVDSFAHSLHYVFLAAAPLALIAFGLAFALRETPLKEEAHMGARERRESDAEAAMPPMA